MTWIEEGAIQAGVDAEALLSPDCGRDAAPSLTWAVAHTHPNREAWAADNLGRAGYVPYFPTHAVLTGAPPRLTHRPLFRSYVFIGLEPGQGWVAARYVGGVRKLCMAGDRPNRVPRGAVEALQATEGARRAPPLAGSVWPPGTACGLGNGSPLDGIDAVVRSVDGDNCSVQVLMFGELRDVNVKVKCLVLRRYH